MGGFDYSFASGATFSLAAGPLSFVNPLSSLSLSAITIWAETGSFAMDDLLINGLGGSGGPPVAPIPEPGTYALMALGLAVVGWQTQRRRQGASSVPA